MPDLYPLRLVPDFRERVWGTRDLGPLYATPPGKEPIGEVWLTGDDCRVSNGPLAGRTLGELVREFGRDLVGDAARGPGFPLLIKFLFPEQKLSVQVHPDDQAARRAGLPRGKSECWYVLAAKPGATIGLGLKRGVTRARFEQGIRDGQADELLHWVEVHRGEMLYSPAGTVHAIGPGVVLVETQQNSDTTYRLYDYGRGRELHVAEGLAAIQEETRAGKVERMGDDDMARLIAAPHFAVDKQATRGTWFRESAPEWSSVEVLVGLDGGGLIESEGSRTTVFSRGEAVVIPASLKRFTLKPQGEVEFLSITLPQRGEGRSEPRTYL